MRRVVVAESLFKALSIHNQPSTHLVLGIITLPKPLIRQKRAPVTSQKGWRLVITKKKVPMDRGKAMTCDIVCERAKNKKEDVGEIFGNVHWCR